MGRQKHNKLRIGIDIDNVVINSTQAVIDYYNSRTGGSLCIEDIKTYDMANYVQDEYRDDFYSLFWREEALKNAQPLPYCIETVKALYEQGYEIYFVTATCPANLNFKYKMLCDIFPFLNVYQSLISAYNKQVIDIDVLIDDCWDNAVNGSYYTILLDYPWNVNYDDAQYGNVYRVPNWKYVIPMIEYIEKMLWLNR